MRKVKEKKAALTIEERAEQYQKELEQEEINNTVPVDTVPVVEHNGNGNRHKEDSKAAIENTIPVALGPDADPVKKRTDEKDIAKALERQHKIDREKDIPGIGSIVAADDEKLPELTNITSDTAFTYSVMDMQDAIFENAMSDEPVISLRQLLKNKHMRYSKSIDGEGIVQVLKAMEFKTVQSNNENNLNLFGSRK